MKTIAQQACKDLADKIFDARRIQHIAPSRIIRIERTFWDRADRIERRFHCIGATDYFLSAMLKRQKQFLAAESQRHDQQFPDRRTYLHR